MTAAEPDALTRQRRFLEVLPVVDRILGVIARRHALGPSEEDEFSAWVRGRLVENDYAILHKFGGRSSIQTYLSVVISNLFRDYRNSLWGRWRPSAAALRLGPIGVRLEELIGRDGASLREAAEILRGRGVGLSDREFARLASRLPARAAVEVDLDGLAEEIPDPAAEPRLSAEVRSRVLSALHSAIETLPAEDRLITRLRFWDGVSVADIARILRVEQKPLYRRLLNIQRGLRGRLELLGVGEREVGDVLSDEHWGEDAPGGSDAVAV